MLPHTSTLRPARRLLAALVTLSVLLSTLGWAHPACALPATHDGPAAAASRGGTAPAEEAAACHPEAPDSATEQTGCDPHGSAGAPPCTLTTQCTTVVVVTAAAFLTVPARPALRPAARGEALPLRPAQQPDSPPPRR